MVVLLMGTARGSTCDFSRQPDSYRLLATTSNAIWAAAMNSSAHVCVREAGSCGVAAIVLAGGAACWRLVVAGFEFTLAPSLFVAVRSSCFDGWDWWLAVRSAHVAC
jgi:hypothetical protein